MLKLVPINRSSHDLEDTDFADHNHVTATNVHLLFAIIILDGANSINTDLHIYNLRTGQFVI